MMRPRFFLLAAACACAASLLTACRGHDAPSGAPVQHQPPGEVVIPADSPQRGAIAIQPVQERTQQIIAVLPAQLVMNEDHTVRVFSPVAGRILQLDAQPGSWVARGQPLAHIVSGDAAQAASDLTRAAAAAALTEAALRRAQDLYAHHVIALKDLEQAHSDDAQAHAELVRARARGEELRVASGAGGEFVLRAPVAGAVIERNTNPGAEVRPDATAPLFVVSDLGSVWLTASAYQQDLGRIHRGERLEFSTDAVSGRVFTGTVTYVGDALDPQTRTVTVRAVLDNADHVLRPQIFGEARLLAPDHGHVPAVPAQALITHRNQTVVFVEVAPGRFVRRPVTVGDDDGATAAITSGLRVGERVVTRGSILLAAEADAGDVRSDTPADSQADSQTAR